MSNLLNLNLPLMLVYFIILLFNPNLIILNIPCGLLPQTFLKLPLLLRWRIPAPTALVLFLVHHGLAAHVLEEFLVVNLLEVYRQLLHEPHQPQVYLFGHVPECHRHAQGGQDAVSLVVERGQCLFVEFAFLDQCYYFLIHALLPHIQRGKEEFVHDRLRGWFLEFAQMFFHQFEEGFFAIQEYN